MDINLVIPTIVTIFLALIGYLATYLNNLRLSQLAERLDRVNRQLGEFYGPMFAMTHASDIAWRAFRSVYRPGQTYFGEGKPLTDEELKTWRLWMSTVFMPVNLRVYEIILSKSDLLIEPQMPECLLMFCAHVAAYQAVLKKWENKDFSEHTSLVNYPAGVLLDYARESFQKLKTEQEELLGRKYRKR
jgi:hypothetical protein